MDVHPCPGEQGGQIQQRSHKPGEYTVGSKDQNRNFKTTNRIIYIVELHPYKSYWKGEVPLQLSLRKLEGARTAPLGFWQT